MTLKKKPHNSVMDPLQDEEEDDEDEDTEEMNDRERARVVRDHSLRVRPVERRKPSRPRMPESIRYLPPITMFD